MGKKKYVQAEVSSLKTEELGIPDLLVLDGEGDDDNFYAVHHRYFKDKKSVCPACGSTKTRCSKVLKRKFKDIFWQDDDTYRVFNLFFYQRYLRCDGCKDSVFPEDIDFAEKGCRYTNRLSDALADGTFLHSYKKVCNYFGVPASTASVGVIMRRRIQYRESLLAPIKTPSVLCIIEAPFYGNIYPVVLALWDDEVYCIDILEDTTEAAYAKLFKTLDVDRVETVFIDPDESLHSAVDNYFPTASVVVTDECIFRYANNAMLDIIHADGKRFPVKYKENRLTLHKKHLPDDYTRKQINEGLMSRPRLKTAYECYQQLLELKETEWSYEELVSWVDGISNELSEFEDLSDVIDIYETEVKTFLDTHIKPPEVYSTSVQAICEAIRTMPHCIFDVLRARVMLTIEHDTIEEDDEIMRLGIRVDRLTKNMNDIALNIKEEREYGI